MSDSSTPTASASIEIEAPADVVWKLVSDLSRMGEWSPETVKIEWKGSATEPAIGASFTGTNQNGNKKWSTKGRIVEL
ncbi:MAG: SRPBCC family protein, partial [Actinomycetota bacterium]|nr:SRPBCC family protein [Actinomycetota bacterium]